MKKGSLTGRLVLACVKEAMGLEDSVQQMLKGLPDNERFDLANPEWQTQGKYKIVVMSKHSSYSQDLGNNTARIIDLLGPCEEVPDYMVASSEHERRENLNHVYNIQNQLVILPTGVYIRNLHFHAGYNSIHDIESIHLSRGKCEFEDRSKPSHEKEIKSTRTVWEAAVKEMVAYFLRPDIHFNSKLGSELYRPIRYNDKILYGSEECRNVIVKTLGENGLKKVE